MTDSLPTRRPFRIARCLAGLAAGLAFAATAAGSVPGPPLDPGFAPGAYCAPGGGAGLGAAGFASAVAAVAWVGRRRRASA